MFSFLIIPEYKKGARVVFFCFSFFHYTLRAMYGSDVEIRDVRSATMLEKLCVKSSLGQRRTPCNFEFSRLRAARLPCDYQRRINRSVGLLSYVRWV